MKRSPLRRFAFLVLLQAAGVQAQSVDPANPTCPPNPDWSTSRTMTFRVVERTGERPILHAEGVIDAGLILRLEAVLADFRGDEIRLRSPGGDARVGREAAMLIRRSGATTRIPAGWACNGACAFMFMGGIVRSVEPGGLFILQQTVFAGGGDLTHAAEQSALLATQDIDFLTRMGVSRALASEVLYNRAGTAVRRCLTPAELTRYNVANEPVRR